MRKLLTLGVILAGLSLGTDLLAQEAAEEGGTDLDALFGETDEGEDWDSLFDSDEPTVEVVEETESDLFETFLLSDGFEWGGSLDAAFTGQLIWETLGAWDAPRALDETNYEPDVDAQIWFDSRPESDYRVRGKFQFLYPFQEMAYAGGSPLTNEDGEALSVSTVKVLELFADFQIANTYHVRVGKFPAKWGAGYFFSPVDILNLGPIDPQDPEADREGPLTARAVYSWDAHALEINVISQEVQKPEDLIYATKGSIVAGTAELEFGGLYQYNHAPKMVASITSPLWEIDVFAELLVQYESDQVFLDPDNLTASLNYDEHWFLTPTAGLSYRNEDWDFFAAGQYIYDSQLQYIQVDNMGDPLLASEVGAHLTAALLQWTDLWGTDLGFLPLRDHRSDRTQRQHYPYSDLDPLGLRPAGDICDLEFRQQLHPLWSECRFRMGN
jgi:hypothetical protein